MPQTNSLFSVAPQSTPYTCGPASLSIVAQLLGFDFPESLVATILDSRPVVGTDNIAMEEWAYRNLPVKSAGSSTYTDGLSIWNIRNAISGVGHFVVVLGVKAGRVRYFDPFWARTFEFDKSAIDFSSDDGRYVEWSINFQTDKSFFEAVLKPTTNVIPEWALKSLDRWMERYSVSPVSKTRRCPLGGECSCDAQTACKSR